MPCPTQDDHTLVLLIFGQSNAANHQGQRYESNDPRVVNYSGGKCYKAASPLLGPDGVFGESWTLLANKLVATGRYSHIIIASGAIGGTLVESWTPRGYLAPVVQTVISDLLQHYVPTHVLWHQGEADYHAHTTEKKYSDSLRDVIEEFRQIRVNAPVYISVASFEQSYRDWRADNSVTRAQRAIVDNRHVFSGPNTDSDVKAIDRYDGTHFSATGQEKFADDWYHIITAADLAAR